MWCLKSSCVKISALAITGFLVAVFGLNVAKAQASNLGTLLNRTPIAGATCPLTISPGAANKTVKCARVFSSTPTNSSCGGINGFFGYQGIESFPLPASGQSIHYSIDAISATFSFTGTCIGGNQVFVQIALYDNEFCFGPAICTTACNSTSTAICTGNNWISGCPATPLQC